MSTEEKPKPRVWKLPKSTIWFCGRLNKLRAPLTRSDRFGCGFSPAEAYKHWKEVNA